MVLTNQDFIESYDSRYKKGYMEGWPQAKKDRVKKYLVSLQLPAMGVALDFGCGKGDFTSVLKEALPLWDVYGCDISAVALDMARMKIVNCTFLTMEEIKHSGMKFNLLFSHHVIEHVPDLLPVFSDFGGLVDQDGYMIHILPSRCENTFEHWVAKSANDGINTELGNRYYFEHPGHLRRLSAHEFSRYCIEQGFTVTQQNFSNKIFGTLNWITATDTKFIKNMFDISRVSRGLHKLFFLILQVFFVMVSLLRAPFIQLPKAYAKRKKSKRKYLLFLSFLCLYPFSFMIDKVISFFAEIEWLLYRKSGSEMYLFSKRVENKLYTNA